MSKKELGNKHVCDSCGTKFYDMGKENPSCPKCGWSELNGMPSEISEFGDDDIPGDGDELSDGDETFSEDFDKVAEAEAFSSNDFDDDEVVDDDELSGTDTDQIIGADDDEDDVL